MPVVQGRTRAQIRQSIGYNLGAVYVSSASGNGLTTTIVDNSLIGADDNHNGKWVVFNDADGTSGQVTRISDYVLSTTTLTLSPAIAASSATDDTYELWDDEYNPAGINDFINQAIIDASDRIFDPVESLALHTDGHQLRFDVPSGLSMLQNIYYRNSVDSKRIHACASTFDETPDSAFTQTLDTQDRKQGSQSLQIGISTSAEEDDVIADSITSLNIAKYDTVEMWVKSTVATNAGDLKLHLDSATITEATAHAGNTDEELSIPALSADTWTFVRMSLDNPESDTAIVSVALELHTDIASSAAVTVWIDDISAVENDTAEWTTLDRRNWRIDKEARDLILGRDGHDAVGYSLIKITGGDKPALLTSDATATEINENFIIAHATNLALISTSGGPATDPDAKRQLSAYWAAQAERSRRALPLLVNVRQVE